MVRLWVGIREDTALPLLEGETSNAILKVGIAVRHTMGSRHRKCLPKEEIGLLVFIPCEGSMVVQGVTSKTGSN